MTPLDKVFMLDADDMLDEDVVVTILRMGHSRVPVHAPGDRTQVIGLLIVKELLLSVKVRAPSSRLGMSRPGMSRPGMSRF